MVTRIASNPILVIGASGWIGHYLVPALTEAGANVIAGYATTKPHFDRPPQDIVQVSSSAFQNIEYLNPGTVINLGRGEEEQDFRFHQHLVELSNTRCFRYIYASSFNAVDQDVSKAHLETDAPAAQTDYGKFKARCENELMTKCKRPLVLRFSGVHGWAPNRVSRTEEFLQKLAEGNPVPVYGGLLQNRIFAGDLADQIAMLALDHDADGIFHLGTSDSSEELDFHRKLALAFGYDPDQVILGKTINWNAVMVLRRFPERFPNFQIPTEADTLRAIREQPGLMKYPG